MTIPVKIIFYRYEMIGGLSKALTFKNVNGSCLIDCTLNSILNSHTMLVKLYSLTSSNISLSDSFELILSGIHSATHEVIYKYLLSAFVHDYINNNKNNVDKNKLLFISKIDEEYINVDELDDKYKAFVAENMRMDIFIGHSGNIASRHIITMYDDLNLKDILVHFKDIYILLFTKESEYKTVLDLNRKEIQFSRKMIKRSITSTGDYICTDMILYKGNDTSLLEYSHVVYYNLLDNTLIDNNERRKVPLTNLIIPSNVHNYVSYIELTNSHTVYVPCILHYQKIHNNSKALGLTGKLSDYENPQAHTSRIKFIIDEVSSYTEDWYREKSLNYLRELEH